MAPVFSKNAILVGTVNYFCLVCETHLKSERDTDVHISKPVHQKQLEAIQYVHEFKADGIKKIKNKYFCELCNKVLAVAARVRLHVAEQSHADTKYKNSFKRIGNYLSVFGKVAICDQSWNGLSESACALCNVEYEDGEIHKNLSSHILNVIQLQVDSDNDQNVYRTIDDLHCQCLTCNKVLALNSLASHFVGDEHKTLYQACCDAYNNITLDTQPDKTIKDETTKSETIKREAAKNDPESIGNDSINYTKASKPRVNNQSRITNKVIKENVQKDTQPDKTIKDDTTKSETIKKEAAKNDPESIGNDNINHTKASKPRINNQNRITNKVIKENVQKYTQPDKTIKDKTTKSETIKKEATKNDPESIGNDNINYTKASKRRVNNQNWITNKVIKENVQKDTQPDKTIKDETTKSETIKIEATKNDPESIGNDNINYTKASKRLVNNQNRITNKVIKENVQKDTQPDKTIKDETTKSETIKIDATKNDPESIGNDNINYTKASKRRVNNQNRITNKVIKENVQKAFLNLSKIYLQKMETNNTSTNEKENAQKYANMTLEDPDNIVGLISGTIGKSFLASKESGRKPNKFGPKGINKTVFSTPVIITCNIKKRNEDDTSNTEILVQIYVPI